MYFNYRQNNSGGSFVYDEARGISVRVIIEADSADEANARAESIGIYFDDSMDCDCCGSRWSEAYDSYDTLEGELPEPDDPFIIDESGYGYSKWVKGYEGFVHLKNGVSYGFGKKTKKINPKKYGGENGFGFYFTATESGEIFPVDSKGWAKDGNRSAPSPGYQYGRSGEKILATKELVIYKSGLGTCIVWGLDKKVLESVKAKAEVYNKKVVQITDELNAELVKFSTK